MRKIVLQKLVFLVLLTFIFTGCYEDYLIISSDFKSCKISKDSSQVFFFHILKAGQPPKGISRFPDGGTNKIIYENISLYTYDINKNKLITIYDFGQVPFNPVLEHVSIQSKNIAFSISPLIGWNWVKEHSTDSLYKKIYNKYQGFYTYSIQENSINRFTSNGYFPELSPDEKQIIYLTRDTLGLSIWHLLNDSNSTQKLKDLNLDSPFVFVSWEDTNSFYYKANKTVYELNISNQKTEIVNNDVNFYANKIPIRKIKELTSEINFKDWGFDLNTHWEKSKKEFILDIVQLKGNLNYRKAILQVLSLNQNEIKTVLDKMLEHENSLEGLEKQEYMIYSKETKDMINHYLK